MKRKTIISIVVALILCCIFSIIAGVVFYNNWKDWFFIRGPQVSVTMTPGPNESKACIVGGCSGQLCLNPGDDSHSITTCEWVDYYACFDYSTCERQPDGNCAWTETPDFMNCMEQYGGKL